MKCKRCGHSCVKNGVRADIQRFRGKGCGKEQQQTYRYNAYSSHINSSLTTLVKEGSGIRSIARILRISVGTVISRIKAIAHKTKRLNHFSPNGTYEIDELWTYIGKKESEVWITYSLDRRTKSVVGYNVGSRTKSNLQVVTESTLTVSPKQICTDGLILYKSLLPIYLHHIGLPHTRRIERFNLNLRTHLKRLMRKTICFSRSQTMLESCLKIYFWA